MMLTITREIPIEPWLYFLTGALIPTISFFLLSFKKSNKTNDNEGFEDEDLDGVLVGGPSSQWSLADAPYKVSDLFGLLNTDRTKKQKTNSIFFSDGSCCKYNLKDGKGENCCPSRSRSSCMLQTIIETMSFRSCGLGTDRLCKDSGQMRLGAGNGKHSGCSSGTRFALLLGRGCW